MTRKTVIVACGLLLLGGCGDDEAGEDGLGFGAIGSPSEASGRGSFRFGAATAATQIEDQNPAVDWFAWTTPEPEGRGQSTFIGDASQGFSRALDDVALLEEMQLDSYRFSIEWARIEPARDQIDEAGLAHYDAFIDALLAAGIRPMVTLHHFSNPIWVDDPLDADCAAGPSDANLCGWGHPEGGAMVVDEFAEHVALIAERYGDRVDEWCVLNEPINYLFAAYAVGFFPPGKALLGDFLGAFVDVLRDYIAGHARGYDALKAGDLVDADGDGVAASVGSTLSVVRWRPSRNNAPSDEPEDIAANDRMTYAYHHLFVDAVTTGELDTDLDAVPDEPHPDWAGRLDWLGVQYYFHAGVTAAPAAIPGLGATPCVFGLDLGSCLPLWDETKWVPEMLYEFEETGFYDILVDYSARYPELPLLVTESGIATHVGARRAEQTVRTLEQLHRAIEDGVDLRGYYHWSLIDNFEWAEGYGPRFGLYEVDYDGSYARTPTEGATVLGEIAGARRITAAQQARFGGLGPMTPEAESEAE